MLIEHYSIEMKLILFYRPVVAVASVFGSVIGVLVIVVVVGYCYTRHYRQGHGKSFVSPEIQVTSTGKRN